MKIPFSGFDTLFGLKRFQQGTLLAPFGELFEYIFDVVFDVFFGVVFCLVSVSFCALLGSLRGPKGIPKRIQKGAKRMFYLEPGFGDHVVSFFDIFVSILGGFKEYFWSILGGFWDDFGNISGVCLLLLCCWFASGFRIF